MATQLGDFRFEGYSNAQLADQVNKLKAGLGAAAMQPTVDALHSIAQDLSNTNQILTTQLGKIGIDWHSAAGQGAQQQMTSTVTYTDGAQDNLSGAGGAMTTQTDSYSVAKGAPAPSTDTQKSFVDNAAGFFGYQTDHSKEVEQAQADRDQAIQQLNSYQSNSQDAIASTAPMSAPPNMNLTAQPVQGTSIGQVGYSGTVGGYAGPGGGGYAGGGYSQVGGPGGGGYAAPGSVPGGGAGGVPGPGGVSAVGPGMGRLPGAMPPAAAAAGGLLAEEVGLGAALAGGAGAVAAGARSGNPNTIVRGGGTNAAPGEKANTPSKASATAGAIDEEQAAQARAAERIAPGKPGASMMQPGAAGGRGKKEEDSEHDRKYTVEEDLFGEQRMVAPTVLGEDPDA